MHSVIFLNEPRPRKRSPQNVAMLKGRPSSSPIEIRACYLFDASRLSNLTRTSEMKALFLSALAIVAVFASCSIHAELSSEPAVAQALRKSWEDPRVKESLRRAINMYPALGQQD